jgi:hypothetical protein
LDDYPIFDVDLEDLVQPSFSAIAPFVPDVEPANVPLGINSMSSLSAPSSPALIDIDSSSEMEFLDLSSSSGASAFDMALDSPELSSASLPFSSPPPSSPLVQSTLPFQSISREEWLDQERRRWEETIEERVLEAEAERLRKERKKTKRKAYERTKKRAQLHGVF